MRSVVADLLKHPGIQQGTDTGFLGIYMADLSSGVRNQIGYTGQGGVAVQQVFSGSPADQAGIQPGDVILQVDGKSYDSVNDLHNYIGVEEAGRHDPPRSLVARHQEAGVDQARRDAGRPADGQLQQQQQQQQDPQDQQP